jgi:RNA polymerase sigma-70 factor (ECF subfamily)
LAEGSDKHFARLFSESREALSRYVRRLVRTPGAAEEIVQEAFLRTYRQGDTARPMRPYLFTVARNLAFKARRHDRVADAHATTRLDASELHWTSDSPEEVTLAEERMRLLNEAIGRLPPQCRAAFTRRMFQEQSYKEIAAHLGISPRTVEKHIAFGVSEVHAALARRYREEEIP